MQALDPRPARAAEGDPEQELPAAFFELVLGRTLVRSCAYFRRPDETLEQAQRNALDLTCRKLRLEPGHTLLDVGCGFGSLILWAAKYYGVRAHGVTASATEAGLAAERIRREGLDRTCRVLCGNPAELIGSGEAFDRIAVVGVADLPGVRMQVSSRLLVAALLKRDGFYLENRISPRGDGHRRRSAPETFDDPSCEIVDVEQLRGHYALTCAQWAARLTAERERALELVSPEVYESVLSRLRAAGELAARGGIDLYQRLVAREELVSVAPPFTRDAIYAAAGGRSIRA